MKIKLVFLILNISLIINCAGLKETNINDSEIRIIEINSWLNLMPGGPGSFHLSGEFTLFQENDEIHYQIEIKKISVYTKNKLIYTFKPELHFSGTEPDISAVNKIAKVYQFFTGSGLEISEQIMAAESIDVELHFILNKQNIIFQLNDIELTRAY